MTRDCWLLRQKVPPCLRETMGRRMACISEMLGERRREGAEGRMGGESRVERREEKRGKSDHSHVALLRVQSDVNFASSPSPLSLLQILSFYLFIFVAFN